MAEGTGIDWEGAMIMRTTHRLRRPPLLNLCSIRITSPFARRPPHFRAFPLMEMLSPLNRSKTSTKVDGNPSPCQVWATCDCCIFSRMNLLL